MFVFVIWFFGGYFVKFFFRKVSVVDILLWVIGWIEGSEKEDG